MYIEATETKVCPKCGQTPLIVPTLLAIDFYAICRGCGIETAIAPTREAALQLWNQGLFDE